MRLIDADAFKKQIAGMTIANNYPVKKASALCDLIDAQPTAYDTDNVLERLNKASYERFGNDGMGGELVVNLDDVIEIIKAGGKIYGKVD